MPILSPSTTTRCSHRTGLLLWGLALSGLLGTSLSAQVSEIGHREVIKPGLERELSLDPRSYAGDRLLVKFPDRLGVRFGSGSGRQRVSALRVTRSSIEATAFAHLLEKLRGLEVEPLFTRSPADLDAERAAIQARLPRDCEPPTDLVSWYRLYTSGRAESRRILAWLLRQDLVECAEPEFRPELIVPAPVPGQGPLKKTGAGQSHPLGPATPLYEPLQYYLFPAPWGVGYVDVLGLLGAQGYKGQTVIHIEAAWNLQHEDLPGLRAKNVLGNKNFGAYKRATWIEHGTAVVGILHARRDERGVRGFVPRSQLRVVSAINGYANMVSLALAKGKAGDVFTSSLVFPIHYKNVGYHAPMDWPQSSYDVLRNTALKGIVVTVAAGNSGTDLATQVIFGKRYTKKASPSGAIICGATYGPVQSRISWSNFGDRVTANSWGWGVTTTGYGHFFFDATGNRRYTPFFGGTSAATPIVAGTLASLQCMSKLQKGRYMSVAEIKGAMVKYGTLVKGGIGRRLDLKTLTKGLGLWKGLRTVSEPRIGSPLLLEVDLPASTPYVLLLASSPTAVRVPPFDFLNNVFGGTTIHVATSPGKPFIHSFATPRQARLKGLTAELQIFYLTKSLGVNNTSTVELWLR